MNGIEKIKAKLEADALAEIKALNEETAAKCAEIKAEYDEKAQKEYSDCIQEGTKAAEIRVQRLASTADMEAKKSILAFKQEMVSKAFERAIKSISEMPRENYIKFLAGLAAKAASNGMEEIIFNENDKKSVGEDAAKAANELLKAKGIAGKLTVSEETRAIPGGLILKQGDIEVNCAADTLVMGCRNDLASQVAELLFA